MLKRLNELCKQNNTSLTALCIEITGSSGNLSTWKKGNIRLDYFLAICNKFHVSADYLLGLSKFPNSKIGINDKGVSLYLKLDENDKAEIRGEMKQMLKADKYKAEETAI